MTSKGRDFDHLLRYITVENNNIDDTPVLSSELDLNLPRGFIAVIKRLRIIHAMDSFSTSSDFERLNSALVRDPDDSNTTRAPAGTQHDVVADLSTIFFSSADAADRQVDGQGNNVLELNFTQDEDMPTARNMRFNSVLSEPTDDGYEAICQVWYTVEEVTDADILNMLEIF